ncbi:MAG: bifunctional DNA-formamidopyrimidine glycosylase/DNA-(apurinic or apyrimidinic site) lyase [Luminiphilus sp.]|nr:bifunctional DNA-formamidopyrimidine glycosylase/DNA-(apurinic or apyrimidinic site) lyase [Pseudomonadales bacterium]MBL6824351.1 bifunctional DNA-formamidopyrimidine glycosylase/DNA-(apurinic or apyrimidinic site) lyase [Luminiphilus sp.]
MPELPEVETTRRGIEPFLSGQTIERIHVRETRLRWPVSLPDHLAGSEVLNVTRRAKYILIETETGALVVHLGMSGSLRVVTPDDALRLHDHIDIEIKNGPWLRYNDPRRFGSFHFAPHPCQEHWLLKNLGPEPLGNEFSGDYLFATSRRRRVAVKNHIMDGKVVVGVGNIYAAESLFRAGIRPSTPAHKVSRVAYQFLAAAIRDILGNAINVGGTTLRDFVGSDGQPGYFKQSLNVYGRQGEGCRICGSPLKLQILGQRSTVYCPVCQRFSSWKRPVC